MDITLLIIVFALIVGVLYYLDFRLDLLGGNFVEIVIFLGGVFATLAYIFFKKDNSDTDTSREEEIIEEKQDEIEEIEEEKEEKIEDIEDRKGEIEDSKQTTDELKDDLEQSREEFDKKMEDDKDETAEKEKPNEFDNSDSSAEFIDDIISSRKSDEDS